jgi:hypothetical protein
MTHFNFHLTGDESPEQTRRIANAVLALGGLTSTTFQSSSTKVGEITVGVKIDTTNATTALDKLAAHPGAKWVEEDAVTANVGESPSEYMPPHTSVTLPNCELPPDPSQVRAVYMDGVEVHSAVQPTPPIPTTSGLDAKGLPWDERIHSSSRAINADGTWRYRKNVPDETKQAVEAELRLLTKSDHELKMIIADGFKEIAQIGEDEGLTIDPKFMNGSSTPAPPVPLPPAPPVPASTTQRSYSDVVNLIMANQATLNKPELYVAVLGMSLPEFAAACIAKPELATVAYDELHKLLP